MTNTFVWVPLDNYDGGNSDKDSFRGALIWVLLGPLKKELFPSG